MQTPSMTGCSLARQAQALLALAINMVYPLLQKNKDAYLDIVLPFILLSINVIVFQLPNIPRLTQMTRDIVASTRKDN